MRNRRQASGRDGRKPFERGPARGRKRGAEAERAKPFEGRETRVTGRHEPAEQREAKTGRGAAKTVPNKGVAGGAPPRRLKKVDPRTTREPRDEEAKAAAQTARTLSGSAARYLRGLGHHLDPVVQIGKEGITDGVVAATREALLAHELVKVKLLQDAPIDRKLAGPDLAERAGAALAQTLGRTLLLYKRHPHKPKIVLPR
jgi:RNA-binding protein